MGGWKEGREDRREEEMKRKKEEDRRERGLLACVPGGRGCLCKAATRRDTHTHTRTQKQKKQPINIHPVCLFFNAVVVFVFSSSLVLSSHSLFSCISFHDKQENS